MLKRYGEPLFEHLVIFAPTVEEFGGLVSPEAIAEFVDQGGNVLVAGNSQLGEALREVASEVGFEADEEGTAVIDHLSHDAKDEGKHTLVVAPAANLIASSKMTGGVTAPLLYRGVGLLVDPANPLVLEVLTGSSTSYSHNPDTPVTEYPHAVGKQVVLVAALQARNNARVVFSGSLDFFSDEFFTAMVEQGGKAAVASGNQALARALSDWCFKQAGVLRVDSISHHKEGEASAPAHYTIKDQAVYTIVVKELVAGEWVAFDGTDMQLEFVRIDPFVRVTMENKQGHMVARFKVPDTYGVYQFKVNYNRVGLSRLSTADQVNFYSLFCFLTFSPLTLFLLPDLRDPPAARQVRAVHRAGLPLLRLLLLHDGRRLRVRHRLPPLQGGGRRQEDPVEVSATEIDVWCALVRVFDPCDLQPVFMAI